MDDLTPILGKTKQKHKSKVPTDCDTSRLYYDYMPVLTKHKSRKTEHQIYSPYQTCYLLPAELEGDEIQYKHATKEPYVYGSPCNFYVEEPMFLPVPEETDLPKPYEHIYNGPEAEDIVYLKYPRTPESSPIYYQVGDYLADSYTDEYNCAEISARSHRLSKKKHRRRRSPISQLENIVYPDFTTEKSSLKKRTKRPYYYSEFSPEVIHMLCGLDNMNSTSNPEEKEYNIEELDKILNETSSTDNIEVPLLSEKYFANIHRCKDGTTKETNSQSKPNIRKSAPCMCTLTEKMKNITCMDDKNFELHEVSSKLLDKSTQTLEDCMDNLSLAPKLELETKETQTDLCQENEDKHGKKQELQSTHLNASMGRILNSSNTLERFRTYITEQHDRTEKNADGTVSNQGNKEYFKKAWPSRY